MPGMVERFFNSALVSGVISFFAKMLEEEKSHDRDEVPETTDGQIIPIAIRAAAADHASQSAEEISSGSMIKAVRSSLFKMLCLIIPYDDEEGNAPAEDKRKMVLFQLVMPFCCTWAVGLPLLPAEIRLLNEFTYSMISIIFSLAFSNILIANLISDRSRATSHGFMVTGVLFGVTAFFMAISIPLSTLLAVAIWLIYLITLIAVIAV